MKDIALYYIVGNQIFQAPLWKDLASSKLWQASASILDVLNELWQAKESATDIKREVPLLERRDDGPNLDNSFQTLLKQFESISKPMPPRIN